MMYFKNAVFKIGGVGHLTSKNKTPKGTADLFVALLDTLKLKSVEVFGISAGGLTALDCRSIP